MHKPILRNFKTGAYYRDVTGKWRMYKNRNGKWKIDAEVITSYENVGTGWGGCQTIPILEWVTEDELVITKEWVNEYIVPVYKNLKVT